MSDAITIHETAKVLVGRYGDKAAVEISKREQKARTSGNDAEAKDWHRVRLALESMKGPPAT